LTSCESPHSSGSQRSGADEAAARFRSRARLSTRSYFFQGLFKFATLDFMKVQLGPCGESYQFLDHFDRKKIIKKNYNKKFY